MLYNAAWFCLIMVVLTWFLAGWGTAEMAVTKIVPFWFSARGVEFQWANLQGALDSNINLVSYIVV